MKVLIFSEMFPKLNMPSSGIFVKKRIEYLDKNGSIDFDFAPVSTYDGLLISIIKKAKNIPAIKLQKYIEIGGRKFKVFKVPLSIITRYNLLKQRTNAWKKYAEKMANVLESNLKIRNYDIIHAHRTFPEGYAAKILSRKYKIPYIVTSHGSEIHSSKIQYKKTIIDILENASKAIFVSENLRKLAINDGYSGNNSEVIPNGIDTELFKPMDKIKIRKELNIFKEGNKYVGFVGNLVYVKRFDKLPEIFQNIIKLCPSVSFIIVGDGPMRSKILKKCNKMNIDVYFAGKVKQEKVPKFMNAMDVMILPSRNEGWPCVILEANACGIPVVGSNNGGISEAIDNEYLIVEENHNFEENFSKRVIDVLTKSKISSIELEKRARMYDWKSIVEKEMNMYFNIQNQFICK